MRIGCTLFFTAALIPPLLHAQANKYAVADWPVYTHDLAGSHYSPLKQINAANVAKLAPFWSYKLQADAAADPVCCSQAAISGFRGMAA